MSFLLLYTLHTHVHVTYFSVLELCSIHVEEHDRALSARWVQRALVIRTIHYTHKCIIHHFSWGGMDAIAAATVASSASLRWIVIRCTVIAVHYWCSHDMLTFQDCRMVHYTCSTYPHSVVDILILLLWGFVYSCPLITNSLICSVTRSAVTPMAGTVVRELLYLWWCIGREVVPTVSLFI